MVFAARQLQEKCQEQNADLYATFVYLTKAFNTINRNGFWSIMNKFGCPDRFIMLVRQFHDGMQAQVLDNGESSTLFPVRNGVKQDSVCAGSNTIQHDVHNYVNRCLPGHGPRYKY